MFALFKFNHINIYVTFNSVNLIFHLYIDKYLLNSSYYLFNLTIKI